MKRLCFDPKVSGLLAALALAPGAWAQDTDHQGRDWAPVGEVYGRHYNIGTCTINQEIFVRPPVNGDEGQGGKLQIEANFINVNANINGAGRGFGGGGGGGGGGGDQDSVGTAGGLGTGVSGGANGANGQAGKTTKFDWLSSQGNNWRDSNGDLDVSRYGVGGNGGAGGGGHGYPGFAGAATGSGGAGGTYDAGNSGKNGTAAVGGGNLRIGSGGAGGGGGGGGGSPANLRGGGGGGGSAGGSGGAMIQLIAKYQVRLAAGATIYTTGSPGSAGQAGMLAGGGRGANALVGLAAGGNAPGYAQRGGFSANPSSSYAPAGGAGGSGGAGSGGGVNVVASIFIWEGSINAFGGDGAANAGHVNLGCGPYGYIVVPGASIYQNGAWQSRSDWNQKLDPPVISATGAVSSPSYEASETVRMSAADPLVPDVKLRYTIDGSSVTEASLVYDPNNPPRITRNTTLKVRAYALRGWFPSEESVVALSFLTPEPKLVRSSPPDLVSNGKPFHSQPIKVSFTGVSTLPGYQIYYTTNGIPATNASIRYTPGDLLDVSKATNLSFIAYVDGRNPSSEQREEVRFKVARPVLDKIPNKSDDNGTHLYYAEDRSSYDVTATASSPGAVIRYEVDGPTPGLNSTVASGGVIPIQRSLFLRVVATREGWEDSDIVPSNPYGYDYRTLTGSVAFQVYKVGSTVPENLPVPSLNRTNEPIEVVMTTQPDMRIVYTIGASDSLQLPSTDGNGRVTVGTEYTAGERILIRRSPTYIRARAFAAGTSDRAPSLAYWRNMGGQIRLGEAILRPKGSSVGLFEGSVGSNVIKAPSPAYSVYKTPDSSPLAPTIGDWSAFVFVPNAPDPADPFRDGALFAAAPGMNDKARWWFGNVSKAQAIGDPVATRYVDFEYVITAPDPAETMTIYHTDGAGAPTTLPVDLSGVPNPTIHYNAEITRKPPTLDAPGVQLVNESPFLYLEKTTSKLRAKDKSGYALIEYQDGPSGPFVGMQVVEIRPYQQDPYPNAFDAAIGDRLAPKGKSVPDPADASRQVLLEDSKLRPARPLVTKGVSNADGTNKGFIYQHAKEGPFDGAVFAVRASSRYSQMEVVWTRKDRFERAVWPYEIRQYAADWPSRDRMQTYVVTKPGQPVGDRAEIPSPLLPTVMDYQTQADGSSTKHASIGAGNVYAATKAGNSLLKLELDEDANAENWIGFRVVRSVARDTPAADGGFNLTPVDQRIGIEIEEDDHLAGIRDNRGLPPFPGFVYESQGDRFHEGIYANDPRSFVNTGKGQIFAVNTGNLEVWWHQRQTEPTWQEGLKIDWPYLVKRYENRWPTEDELTQWTDSNENGVRDPDEVSRAIVDIADQTGTGAINEGLFPDWHLYYQNDKSKRGFNPNDEHAFTWPVQDGQGAFALRNDLGGEGTSLPHLLIPYRQYTGEAIWRLMVFKVTAENFRYLGTAGTPVQPPLPLNQFTDKEKSYALAGGAWLKDRKGDLWCRNGGDDGGLSTIVTRYFYMDRPEKGFFYPSDYAYKKDGMVPWLDRLAVERNSDHPKGEPIDITYRVRWPDYPPLPDAPARPNPKNELFPTEAERDALAAWEEALEDANKSGAWQDAVRELFDREDLRGPAGSDKLSWSPVPELWLGETLVKQKRGLPSVFGDGRSGFESIDVEYDQSTANGGGKSVKLIDPTWTYRQEKVNGIPSEVKTAASQGKVYFLDLPPHLQDRLWYDPTTRRLCFTGKLVDVVAGEEPYHVLPNVISSHDRERVLAICSPTYAGGPEFRSHLAALCAKAAAPREYDYGQHPLNDPDGSPNTPSFALTAADPLGHGYVTLSQDNGKSIRSPDKSVRLEVIRVARKLYTGEVRPMVAMSPFDEKLTMRHSSDFGGRSAQFEVEWRFRPGFLPSNVEQNLNDWPGNFRETDWTTYPGREPANGMGASEVVIRGASRDTLSDNWFIARYKPTNPAHPLYGQWSEWTSPRLAEGWIKRVMAGIQPFEQRVGAYRNGEVDTSVSMIEQIGKSWQGNIPFDLNGIDQYGLLEIYETVMDRGRDLSIAGTPPVDYSPANQALMLAAGRISDLYLMLGNEAYADAADPTIAFGTGDAQFGAQASTLHCFMNQTDSLLGEELALLRGRDDSALPSPRTFPFYNRLPWNLSRDIRGGEVAYVLNYGIRDKGTWGRVANTESSYSSLEDDARRMYPQGHGDAWGHYLSAGKVYYRLLNDPNFSWVSQPEAVNIGGVPVMVDYEDERRFAKVAAAKARAGAEVVNLTYRNDYSEDPKVFWENSSDKRKDRQWGVTEWAIRAGQATYLDWVVGNAILPDVDPDPSHEGIRKIDRTTVPELAELPSAFEKIQAELNNVDAGLNPLGVSSDAVPFDISPEALSGSNPQSHFEQIYSRAVDGLNNSIRVFNQAFNASQRLRQQNDDVAVFRRQADERRTDFKNRLIEIFGYPYPDDIGSNKLYPPNYDGPDLYHYMYYDPSELMPGRVAGSSKLVDINFINQDLKNIIGGPLPREIKVSYNLSTEGFGFVKPKSYVAPRRAEGELQNSHRDLLQALGRHKRAVVEYDNLIDQIAEQNRVIVAQSRLNKAEAVAGDAEVSILRGALRDQESLNGMIADSRAKQIGFQNMAAYTKIVGDAVSSSIAEAYDLIFANTSAWLRGAVQLTAVGLAQGFSELAQGEAAVELGHQQKKESVGAKANIDVVIARNKVLDDRANLALVTQRAQLAQLIGNLDSLELEIYNTEEAMNQAASRYSATLARGARLLEELNTFQANTASDVQQYRYRDMAFRIFRDEALQKYRAQFDLAARYVYLAAKAYDYETGLLGSDSSSAVSFFNQISKSQTIGLIQDGQPVTGPISGDPGLADAMARMIGSWSVLKGRLGFNNPTNLSAEMSLRYEAFRILPGSAGDKVWRETLKRHWIDDLRELPEFRMHCIPPQRSGSGRIPALVVPFSTTVEDGRNLFDWPLAGGDHAYPSSHYAIKIRAAGVGFSNYDSGIPGLSATPYVYLVPVGEDKMRLPTDQFSVRSWRVMDQMIPVPFPIGSLELADPGYLPVADSLSFAGNAFGRIRKFPEMPAYHDGPQSGFNPGSAGVLSNRLVGRSVWNSRWLLIVPGTSLKANGVEGLKQLIDGPLVNGVRTGEGVSDIKIRFDAYSYSGN